MNEANAVACLIQKSFAQLCMNTKLTLPEKKCIRVNVLTLKQELKEIVGPTEANLYLDEERALWKYLVQLKDATKGTLKSRIKNFHALPSIPTSKSKISNTKMIDTVRRVYYAEMKKLDREAISFMTLAFHLPGLKVTGAITKKRS